VVCRNLALTHFDAAHQLAVGAAIARSLRPGGALMLGAHEQSPAQLHCFEPWSGAPGTYRRSA
jgi:chemotaxis methyl-accepting protein methylase